MDFDYSVLDNNEKIIYALRSLYSKHGYKKYKMSKFEEYDLYSKNKDFLVSDSVITFTDTNGKLLALKPDVTLSIIKNTRFSDKKIQKLYYNENVYRVSKGTDSFREIMQAGLECIGDVDDFCVGEVLWLAAESLAKISGDFVLDISSLELISAFTDYISTDREITKQLIKCIGEKNIHGIEEICVKNDIPSDKYLPLNELVMIYGSAFEVLSEIKSLAAGIGASDAVESLEKAVSIFKGYPDSSKIHIDMSVTGDMKYYNGVVFKGFIKKIPGFVLSGGQYDRLMSRLHNNSKAIGFAVYLDMLDNLGKDLCDYDADTLVVYDSQSDLPLIRKIIDSEIEQGKTVFSAGGDIETIRCRKKVRIKGNEVTPGE